MNKINYSNTILILIFCILMAGNSFSIPSVNHGSKQFIVVIDPGHGGKDPGAVNKNIREKDVVLGVGLKLGKLISENHLDVKVIFTRNTDVFIPLIERSRIANKNKANLFISIHANFCATPSTRGTETFVLGLHRTAENAEVAKKENSVILFEKDYSITYENFDPNSDESYIMFDNAQVEFMNQSIDFADKIQHQFKSHLESTDRSVKQAGFLVLRQSSMPSVLIETGFLSNPAEANYLNSEDGQQNIALSVLEAFRKFKSKSSGQANTKTSDGTGSHQKPQDTLVKQEVTTIHQKSQDTLVKQEVRTVNKKTEEKIKEEIIKPIINSEKHEPENADTASLSNVTEIVKTKSNDYYSVQIAANTTPVEPVANNFKGLKNVKREKTDRYYRYYVGNENSLENVTSILKQIKLKFPQAFIVSFVDGKKVPLK